MSLGEWLRGKFDTLALLAAVILLHAMHSPHVTEFIGALLLALRGSRSSSNSEG